MPIGPTGVAPVWGWPDAALGCVLALCFWAVIARAVAHRQARGGSAGPARAVGRVPDHAPVGIGLVLALTVTLLVRGHPVGQVVVAAVAVTLAVLVSPQARARVRAGDDHRSR